MRDVDIHPSFRAAELVIADLCRNMTIPSKQARRITRIEVTHDEFYKIMSDAGPGAREIYPYDHEGPPEFHGMSIYRVDKLPAPGWRVITLEPYR